MSGCFFVCACWPDTGDVAMALATIILNAAMDF
jgi:hypothetical protein